MRTVASLHVAYLACQSSVSAISHFACHLRNEERPGAHMYTDSQASLLPPTKVLRLDNPDLDLGVDVGVQADWDAIDAERADRLVEIDLALLDVVALRFELVSDVGGGDRAE